MQLVYTDYMVLGIDVSTSITGYSIMNTTGLIQEYGIIDLRKLPAGPSLSKIIKVRSKLEEIASQFTIEHIAVEQPMQFMTKGGSSASTMLMLAEFNGIIRYLCWLVFGIEPEQITASTARKECNIKLMRGKNTKEIVLEHLLNTEKGFIIDYTKQGNPKPGSYDIADAVIIAKAGYNHWLKKNS